MQIYMYMYCCLELKVPINRFATGCKLDIKYMISCVFDKLNSRSY